MISLTAQSGKLICARLPPSRFSILTTYIPLLLQIFQETLIGFFQECRLPAEERFCIMVLQFTLTTHEIQINIQSFVLYITEWRSMIPSQIFYYFNSFCSRKFPSALRNIIRNKQINFNCFFIILPSGSRLPLNFAET